MQDFCMIVLRPIRTAAVSQVRYRTGISISRVLHCTNATYHRPYKCQMLNFEELSQNQFIRVHQHITSEEWHSQIQFFYSNLSEQSSRVITISIPLSVQICPATSYTRGTSTALPNQMLLFGYWIMRWSITGPPTIALIHSSVVCRSKLCQRCQSCTNIFTCCDSVIVGHGISPFLDPEDTLDWCAKSIA